PDISAVVICSSTDTHAQIIREAAEASKHIFCEKPIANDLASIDRALDAVERAGVKLSPSRETMGVSRWSWHWRRRSPWLNTGQSVSAKSSTNRRVPRKRYVDPQIGSDDRRRRMS